MWNLISILTSGCNGPIWFMTNKYLILLLLLFCLTIQHCSDHDKDSSEHSHEHHSADTTVENLKMTLNQGKKWEMDVHTRNMISTMQTTFEKADHKSLEQLQKMGTTLQKQLTELISGCTMQGPSHDQLHIILPPFQTTIIKIINARDLKEGREQANHLKGLFERYYKYFQ